MLVYINELAIMSHTEPVLNKNSNAQKLCKIPVPPTTAYKTLLLILFDSVECTYTWTFPKYFFQNHVCQYTLNIASPKSKFTMQW